MDQIIQEQLQMQCCDNLVLLQMGYTKLEIAEL